MIKDGRIFYGWFILGIAWGFLAVGVFAGAFALFALPRPRTTVTPSVR